MIRQRLTSPLALVLALLAAGGAALGDGEADEWRVKREQVFAFAEQPAVTRDGDKVTITFATTAFCDVTVAVEDADGRIVRHLVSGVLGPNAPAPLAKNSKKQTLLWDAKNDRGQYVKDVAACTVRVSLGLQPRFERTLDWTPYKRVANNPPVFAPCPEGMLVYEGQIYDMVRLYGHDGDYLRTVYPFGADKVGSFADLHWMEFPQDGRRLPVKEWFRQATLLSSGTNSNHPWPGYGAQRTAHDGHGAGAPHHAASGMAATGTRVALGMFLLNRMTTAGDSGGLKMNGPKVSFKTIRAGLRWRGGGEEIQVGPTRMAFAPDGRTLYMTGYEFLCNFGTGGKWDFHLPLVAKVDYEGDAEAAVFVGSSDQDTEGDQNNRFRTPLALAVDGAGRVYVADYANDRVQVYTPDGAHHKTIKVEKPAQVAVDPKTGEIYVFSWYVSNKHFRKDKAVTVKPRMHRFGPVNDPGRAEVFDLPVAADKLGLVAQLDTFAQTPTVWLYTGYQRYGNRGPYWQEDSYLLLQVKGGKLETVRDFSREAVRDVKYTRRVTGTNRNLAVNSATGRLYVGNGSATMGFSWSLAIEIDPSAGKSRLVELPFDTEQMCFDQDGQAYLRAKDKIVRFASADWREIPWDYGEQHKGVGVSVTEAKGPGKRTAENIAAALVTPQFEHAPQGVFSVSPTGKIVIPIKGKSSFQATGLVFRADEEAALSAGKGYQFKIYPGRSTGGLVVVFDDRGQIVYDDAIAGIGFTHGVKIDRDDNLYAMVMGTRVVDGKPYFNPATDTLVRFAPGKARIVGTHNKSIPTPMSPEQTPQRPPDWLGGGKTGLHKAWADGADWFYGGVGYNGEHHKNPDYGCDCCHSSFDLDYFARSFAPEVGHCSVAVLDSAGNLILRIGQYGNVDDGVPLVADGGPARPRSIGGDEVALFYAPHLAVDTDRRLFVADVGNERIVSVKLGYHVEQRVPLKGK